MAGAVEGDVAPAVAFEEFDSALLQEFGRGYYVFRLRVAAKRDDWLVFQQEEDVADFFFFAESYELLLKF